MHNIIICTIYIGSKKDLFIIHNNNYYIDIAAINVMYIWLQLNNNKVSFVFFAALMLYIKNLIDLETTCGI